MTLPNETMVEELGELIRFDYDAIGAYTAAIDDVRESEIREVFVRFREDHERHVLDLSAIVRRLGGTPPTKPDLRGFMRKTMTKVAGLGGTKGTLEAMKSNERVLSERYAYHRSFEWPSDIRQAIDRGQEDEKRHLTWIEQALAGLADHSWDKSSIPRASAPPR